MNGGIYMAKYCPKSKEKVVYLTCCECSDKECRKKSVVNISDDYLNDLVHKLVLSRKNHSEEVLKTKYKKAYNGLIIEIDRIIIARFEKTFFKEKVNASGLSVKQLEALQQIANDTLIKCRNLVIDNMETTGLNNVIESGSSFFHETLAIMKKAM